MARKVRTHGELLSTIDEEAARQCARYLNGRAETCLVEVVPIRSFFRVNVTKQVSGGVFGRLQDLADAFNAGWKARALKAERGIEE